MKKGVVVVVVGVAVVEEGGDGEWSKKRKGRRKEGRSCWQPTHRRAPFADRCRQAVVALLCEQLQSSSLVVEVSLAKNVEGEGATRSRFGRMAMRCVSAMQF